MKQCYARKIQSRKQNVVSRKSGHEIGRDGIWKISGVALTLVMLFGVLASLWVGRQINRGLGELSAKNELNEKLLTANKVLHDEYRVLSMQERIEAEAEKLGLSHPGQGQVVGPL